MKQSEQKKIRLKTSKEINDKLVELGKKVIKQLKDYENPSVNIPLRSLSNVYFDEKSRMLHLGNKTSDRSYLNLSQSKSFMQTMLVASKLREVIKDGSHFGLRQLFYMCKGGIPGTKENTFDDQSESDIIIEDIEGLLSRLREEIGIFAISKGKMSGDLKIVDSGDKIDCGKLGSSGYGIPSIVEKGIIDFDKTSVDFVLVVEKEQTWNRLNQDRFWKRKNCLIITGGGQPDRGTRRFLHRLNSELDLPVYVFTDMDIWGYYIYSVYKQGSINLAHFSENAAVPDAKFIGVKMSDVEKFNIPKSHWIPMKKIDYKRVREISEYEWFKTDKAWQKEFKKLSDFKHVVEQDVLVAKGLDFMSKEYLPFKFDTKDWIE
ncbi:DNA topoisomerase [archaeon CG07_land_8_20_14_0_80_38_8]|nr:MAG: DNA topoisomerase [archaeon CG07_land_8_20_14_0_80_38_8]PIU89226.1 MAG: DNA topoisomerase [archaeon CG06_land_8_20_14_3_00_37_11]